MKKSWKTVLSVLLAAVLLLSVLPGIADFGDFSGDSDYGGGSDWSSSDYDSGSDWDYDSGSRRSGSSGESGDNTMFVVCCNSLIALARHSCVQIFVGLFFVFQATH